MKLKHKLTSILLGVLVLLSPVIGAIAPALGSATASAASLGTFQYEPSFSGDAVASSNGSILINCSGSACPGGDGLNYNYVAGSKYKFDNVISGNTSAGSSSGGLLGGIDTCFTVTIIVSNPSKPGNGTLTDSCGHKNTPITIGNAAVFNDFIKAGGAATVGAKVTGKLSVDFGETDDTLSVPSVDLYVRCATANKLDAVCSSLVGQMASGPATLATNPAKFSAITSGFVAGHKYTLCWNAPFLQGSDGTLGDDLCTATFTAKTTAQTVSLNGTGDPSTLSSPDDGSGTSTGTSCEDKVPVLGWLLCKLIDGIQNTVGGIYDHIINPLLTVEPITHKTSSGTINPIYTAWSNFRLYGDVFLFIAILVIVFGESLGGGLLDAYSVKKIMPRLLIAALLINISFYLVAIAVDITNIVGTGVSNLITAPFTMGGNYNLQVGTAGSVGMTTLLVGAIVWAKITLSGQFLAWLWFSVLLPLLLIFLTIMITVLLRQALIIFLVIISPVAFALYCLPNTEKYFRKWWDMLFETLLVFPIVASLFAMGKVSASLLSNSSNGALANGLAQIMAVIALVIPLLLIPFSFKIAGGLIGRAHELASGARTKMNLGGATRERIKTQGARNRLQSREKYYSKLQAQGSKGGVIRRNTLGRLAKGTSGLMGYNVQAEASAARAEVGKTLNDQIATGKDDEIRGLTVNKAWAAKQGPLVRDAEGNMSNGHMRTNAGGVRQYKSLGGQWVNEADVDNGHARWGRDTFAQQTALSYEMRKAQSEGQLQSLAKNYKAVAQGPGGWGMNEDQAGGAWIGAAFERQNEHLEYKDTDWQTGDLKVDKSTQATDATGKAVEGTGLRGNGLIDEIYEKKGSYSVGQMGSNTVQQLIDAHKSADLIANASADGYGWDQNGNQVKYSPEAITKAKEQRRKIAAIAETFMHQQSAGGGVPEDQQAQQAASQQGDGRRQASTPGAGHVAERVVELAELTGVYTKPPETPQS